MCMTVDRCLAVCYPLQAKSICTTRKAKVTLSIVFVTIVIYCIPHYFYARVIGKNNCQGLGVKGTLSTIMSWAGVALNSVIPFTVILILNSLIINTIRKRSNYFTGNQAMSTKKTDADDAKVIFCYFYCLTIISRSHVLLVMIM